MRKREGRLVEPQESAFLQDADPTTAVVVPCFNEADRLPVEAFRVGIVERPEWLWVFVNDGSSDGTDRVLADLVRGHANAQHLDLAVNSGKGEAVRQGVLWGLRHRSITWVGYLDADLATPIEEFARLAERQQPDRLAILGSRLLRLGVHIERSNVRHYFGRVAATAISLLLRMPTYDTQCGAKFFEAGLARQVFQEPFESRWLFDVELLARSRNLLGRQRFESMALEEPLNVWREMGGSKIRLRDLLLLPAEIWKIHRLYNRHAAGGISADRPN